MIAVSATKRLFYQPVTEDTDTYESKQNLICDLLHGKVDG